MSSIIVIRDKDEIMSMNSKEELLNEEDLLTVSEHRFFIKMSLKDRLQIRENMGELRKNYKSDLSKLLRKVMLEYMNDSDFLEYLGIEKKAVG